MATPETLIASPYHLTCALDGVAIRLRKGPQFGQLIFGALTSILSRDTNVEGDFCRTLKILQ